MSEFVFLLLFLDHYQSQTINLRGDALHKSQLQQGQLWLAINSIMFLLSCRSFGVNDKSNCKGQHRQQAGRQKGNVCCLKLIPEGIRLGGDTNEIVKFAQNVMIHINTDSPEALILSNTILMPQSLFSRWDFNVINTSLRAMWEILAFTTYSHQSFAAILVAVCDEN